MFDFVKVNKSIRSTTLWKSADILNILQLNMQLQNCGIFTVLFLRVISWTLKEHFSYLIWVDDLVKLK
jgi:hypothetical protein